MPRAEAWPRIYREAPEVFQAFGRAEDPDGLVVGRLREMAGLEGRTILEIGCGTGRYSRDLAKGAAGYFAMEPSPGMLTLAPSGLPPSSLHWVRARGEALPLRSQSMDLVLATWVLGYLRPDACGKVLLEAQRALRPGGEIWLVENHWTGAFQTLRGREGWGGEPGVRRLIEVHGFQVADVIETELRFPSEGEALRVLGTLCGAEVRERLRQKPRATLGHHVVLLRHPPV